MAALLRTQSSSSARHILAQSIIPRTSTGCPSTSPLRRFRTTTAPPTASPSARTFSTTPLRPLTATPRKCAGDSHGSHYDPPTGWLWGIPPGQKYEKEGWENIFFWGFYGGLGLAVVAYVYKPDTSIETWALEEAKRRLQAEGTLPEDE